MWQPGEEIKILDSVPKSEVVVSVSDDPDCWNIECLFPNARTPLDDVVAVSALLALGSIPKVMVVKNDTFPTVVSIIPRRGWDIKELANEICSFLEGENLIIKKLYKTKKSGELVITPVNYF